ncbi:hypothetical protein BJ944DRAFT_273280 [Cunninghamella echinulata]|nr:hypothetical protein BJ944DRAFT_273280 [Cunninghamella echinulata]
MESIQRITQQTSLASLIALHLGLSLFGALASNPTYNIPIFFFGIWAFNNRETTSPIKTFTWVLSLSIVLDIFWFILHGGNPQNESGFGFAMIMNIISLIGKPVTVFSAINTIQSRGDTFSAGNFDVPGSFPGAYQTVRDGDNDSFA